MGARRMAAQHYVRGKILVDPIDAAACLGDHLGEGHGRKQGEVQRDVGRAGAHHHLRRKGVLALRLPFPCAAVEEDECAPAFAIDIQRLDRTGAIPLGPRLADTRTDRIARFAVALDDLIRVRHPGALLVLIVERLLVVVEEDLGQNRMAMPSSSASELTRSTRLRAILNPPAWRRSWCSTSAPQIRCLSWRHSTSCSVEHTRAPSSLCSRVITFATWCTVRASGSRACARGWRACCTRRPSSVRSSWMMELVSSASFWPCSSGTQYTASSVNSSSHASSCCVSSNLAS